MTNTILFGIGAGLVTIAWIRFINHHGEGKHMLQALLQLEHPMLLMTVAIMLGGLFHSITIMYPALLKKDVQQIEALHIADNFRDQAHRDALTGVHNRRYFDQTISAYVNEFKSSKATFGLMLLDLDHFKSVNDNHGHDAGDFVLKETCLRLRSLVREHDVFARVGGEEFAVIATFASGDQLSMIAERYRSHIESLRIPFGDKIIKPTVSIGAVISKGFKSPVELYNAADTKLYEAKRAGRNCVAI